MFFKVNQHLQMDFANDIPNNLNQTLLKEGLLAICRRNLRTFRRYLILVFYRQNKLQRLTIPTQTQSILWLNISSISIGDSIMELSGRCLLPTKFKLDLLTDKKNASLYTEDDYFQNVYSNIDDCKINSYDLILIDIHNTRSLLAKAKYFKDTSFCAIQGFFYGCDFQRMLFSYNRINALLNYPINPTELNRIAKNYLHLKTQVTYTKPSNTINIGIAIGGVDYVRTYHQWDMVLEQLAIEAKAHSFNTMDLHINLLGTNTNTNLSEHLIQKYQNIYVINNHVNQLSLINTARLIQNLDYFIGCDGGLMHVAEAFNLKGIALFARFPPNLRLATLSQLVPLYNPKIANDIAAQSIAHSLMMMILSNT